MLFLLRYSSSFLGQAIQAYILRKPSFLNSSSNVLKYSTNAHMLHILSTYIDVSTHLLYACFLSWEHSSIRITNDCAIIQRYNIWMLFKCMSDSFNKFFQCWYIIFKCYCCILYIWCIYLKKSFASSGTA